MSPGPSLPCECCGARHRTWRGVAKCRYGKELLWCWGNGPWASVSLCLHWGSPRAAHVTVILFETRQEAEKAKESIDHGGCGGRCSRRHRVVCLDPEMGER
jgi:hypothetical protein